MRGGNGGDLSRKRKKRRQESVGSVDVDPEDLENSTQAERELQDVEGPSKNCRERVSPSSCLIKAFRNKHH